MPPSPVPLPPPAEPPQEPLGRTSGRPLPPNVTGSATPGSVALQALAAIVDLIKKPIEQYRGDPRQGVFLIILTALLLFFVCFVLTLIVSLLKVISMIGFMWFSLVAMLGLVLLLTAMLMFVPPPDASLSAGQRRRAEQIAVAPIQ